MNLYKFHFLNWISENKSMWLNSNYMTFTNTSYWTKRCSTLQNTQNYSTAYKTDKKSILHTVSYRPINYRLYYTVQCVCVCVCVGTCLCVCYHIDASCKQQSPDWRLTLQFEMLTAEGAWTAERAVQYNNYNLTKSNIFIYLTLWPSYMISHYIKVIKQKNRCSKTSQKDCFFANRKI